MHHKLLHQKTRTIRGLILFSILSSSFISSCHRDSHTKSEEETAYMADYESPSAKWGFLDKQGQLAIKAEFDDVGPFSEGLAAVNKNGLWGFIDHEGGLVIEPIYKSVWAFHENKARVQQFDQPEQYIDRTGKPMDAENWSAADDFSNGRARVKVGNSFGYIDSSGKLLVQPIFTRGWNFSDDLCIVEYQEKLGVINLKGDYVLQPKYDFIKINPSSKIILCRQGTTAFAFNQEGNEIANIPESKMTDSDGHLVAVREGSNMYLFNLSGKKPIDTTLYTNIIYLEDSLWAGKTKEGYILLNPDGKPVTTNAYKQINKFSDGLAAYNKGDYWGYMDQQGIERTKDVFGLAWDYKEGLARAAF